LEEETVLVAGHWVRRGFSFAGEEKQRGDRMKNVKILCHMCFGAGKRWNLNDEGKPVQLCCEYCEGKGTVTDEGYERYFIEFDCE
jgi:hypothetical protein